MIDMQINARGSAETRPFAVVARLLVMAAVVLALVTGSTGTRKLPPGQRRTIWLNLLFFVTLGAADEITLAAALNRWPLARASALIGETLALGWFFSPGKEKPASKFLFYVHLGPFFLAVLGGAVSTAFVRFLRSASM